MNTYQQSRQIRRALRVTRIVIAALFSLLLMTQHYGLAQSSAWSSPIRISGDTKAWFPDVQTDAAGRVHLVWAEEHQPWDVVVYATDADGQGFSKQVNATEVHSFQQFGGGEVTRPALVPDALGNLHMSFRQIEINYSRVAASEVLDPRRWTLPYILSNGEPSYFSQIAVDSKGVIHLVYSENQQSRECTVCYHLYYRASKNGGSSWTAPIDISVMITGAAKPTLFIDKRDNLHVVWESGKGGSLGRVSNPTRPTYVASYDGGETWISPRAFVIGANAELQGKNITISEDGEGKLVVVWLGLPEDIVYYQVSRDQGRSWSAPQRLGAVFSNFKAVMTNLDRYSTATDGSGNVHLVMAGRLTEQQKTISLIHVIWNGLTWSEPQEIVNYEDGSLIEWPRIAVGLGNQLHAVWYKRPVESIFDTENGLYSIWYSRAIANAQSIAPKTYAVSTAVAKASPTAQIASQATSLPAFSSTDTGARTSDIVGESQSLGIVALSIVPIVLALGLIVLLRRR